MNRIRLRTSPPASTNVANFPLSFSGTQADSNTLSAGNIEPFAHPIKIRSNINAVKPPENHVFLSPQITF